MNITGNINHVGYDQRLESPYEQAASRQAKLEAAADDIAQGFWHRLESPEGADEFIFDYPPCLESEFCHAVAFARMQLRNSDANRQEILEGMYTHLVNLMDEYINEQAEWKANKEQEA